MTSWSKFFDAALFLLSILVTGLSFMSISSLLLELWQFPCIRDWPEVWKSKIPPSEFYPISGNWVKLGMPNLTRRSTIKFYRMLKNARATAFTVSELLRKNQQEGRSKIPPIQIRVKIYVNSMKTISKSTPEKTSILAKLQVSTMELS